ncbi:hypothetical protein KBX49_07620 [Liquorilactobacillus satsumensis]|uniref:hypothetical protein n=1 Tax=Liquorilactobacillus satsumensis TaxID=259059 RepID=UPI0021C2EFCE|nr:hypothetical protein [Liquorilactobacillus satsumensis]MCP9357966.1 hypothetical protein [Liquorilactobacillus satsumensis]MCP9371783.1 hypothetical protein [Liquorilactobacillus satsumensis]
MIRKGSVVRYKLHLYPVHSTLNKGAYVVALIKLGNHRHEEVPLEQLEELRDEFNTNEP